MDFLIKFPSLIFLIFTGPEAPESHQKEEQKQEIQVEEQEQFDDCEASDTYYFVQGY